MKFTKDQQRMYYRLTGKRMENSPFFNGEACKDTITPSFKNGAIVSAKVDCYGRIESITITPP